MQTFSFVPGGLILVFVVGTGGIWEQNGKEATSSQILDLIKQLGNAKFSKREAASKALKPFAEAHLVTLEKARISSNDIETRRRIDLLIREVRNRQTPPARVKLTIRVREGGEFLYELADRVLGDGNRWPEIYRLNLEINPHLIIPAGTEMRLPDLAGMGP